MYDIHDVMDYFQTPTVGAYYFRLQLERTMDAGAINWLFKRIGTLYASHATTKSILSFRMDYSKHQHQLTLFVELEGVLYNRVIGEVDLFYNAATRKLIPLEYF